MSSPASQWTAQRVMQLAPDPASGKAGQGLASPRKWASLGCDDTAVWGECQGSGAKPYQVQVELSEPAFKCSCPSRKFPCKHGLGLMLMYASADGSVAKSARPPWVDEWLKSRADRAEKKKAAADAPPKPVDEAAQAKRREKRLARTAEGVASIKTWIEDFVRGGIATAPTRGYAFFDEPARRMIDAQAPGVARRLQQLGETASSGADWQTRFFQQLASLYLLLRAFERVDALPENVRDDVLAALGTPKKQEDVLGLPPVADRWQILSQEVELEDRLRVQRTWLFGAATKRAALILNFAHGQSALDVSLPPGSEFQGELCFFTETGVRAALKSRGDVQPIRELAGFETLDALCDAASNVFARQPWTNEIGLPLRAVVPVKTETGWSIVDREHRSLPCAISDSAGWTASAVSGGIPVDLVVTFNGQSLRPLAIFDGVEHVALVSGSVAEAGA